MKEIEILALSGLTQETSKGVLEAFDIYSDLMFPGHTSEKPKSFEEEARDILAVETTKAFAVKRKGDSVSSAKKGIEERGYATSLDAHFLRNKKKYDHVSKMSSAVRGKK